MTTNTDTWTVIMTTAPSIIAAIASLVTAFRIRSVHHLVNSQYSNVLQRLEEAKDKIASLSPTDENISQAAAAKIAVSDHKLK